MSEHDEKLRSHSLGFFGNIWVRQNELEFAGDSVQGHKHTFDHVSLLMKGTVEVEVEGYEPKQFTAPTFIVIKKEHMHKFTAITDDCCWFCTFAMRDINGEVADMYGEQNSPYGTETINYTVASLDADKATTEFVE